MSRRGALLLLLLAATAVAEAPRALAEEGLDASTRRRAELAFFEGRLWDLDGLLAATGGQTDPDHLPILVRDRWWRGHREGARGSIEPARGDADPAFELFLARLRWLAGGGEGPWPVSAAVEDPYPLLTALIQDRIRRERIGSAGLPADGPLEAWWLANEPSVDGPVREVFRVTYGMAVRCYHGDEDLREARELDRKARTLGNRNEVLWLGLLGALAALAFIASLVVSRARD